MSLRQFQMTSMSTPGPPVCGSIESSRAAIDVATGMDDAMWTGLCTRAFRLSVFQIVPLPLWRCLLSLIAAYLNSGVIRCVYCRRPTPYSQTDALISLPCHIIRNPRELSLVRSLDIPSSKWLNSNKFRCVNRYT